MFVGVLRISLHLHGNGSLKGKRKIMRRVIERTRVKFNASVAEVADNDLHQRGVVGVSVIGNNSAHVDSMLSKIGHYVEQIGLAPIANIETEVIPLGGELGGSFGDEWHGATADEEDEW